MSRLMRFKPAATKPWLIASAGIVWSGVGLMLGNLAYGWLLPVALPQVLWMTLVGLMLASVIYYFGFSKLAKKNIQRIIALQKSFAEYPNIQPGQEFDGYE